MNHLVRILALFVLGALAGEAECSGSGELGGDLGFLKRFHTPPATPRESNHYIDLWSGNALAALARVNGLTNNHTLFVDSHGKAGRGFRAKRYFFYPSDELLAPGQKTPRYTAGDLAAVIGPESALQIHNILIAGCNLEGALKSRDLRHYFVNATNITHTVAGQLGFKPMFYQAIVMHSAKIKSLYSKETKRQIGGVEYEVVDSFQPGATRISPYLAELFLPGAKDPFRTATAGREILDPGNTPPPLTNWRMLLANPAR